MISFGFLRAAAAAAVMVAAPLAYAEGTYEIPAAEAGRRPKPARII